MEKIEPEIQNTARDGDCVTLTLRIPVDLHYFKGHFTDAPVLPGVVQLHWAILYSRQYFGLDINPDQVSQLKFKQLILPDMTVSLNLTLQRDKNQIRFGFTSTLGDNASGIIKF